VASFEIVSRRGDPIRSLDDWERLAGPASEIHWQDDRSAKELARAWIDGSGPKALVGLLDRDPRTAGLGIERAVAEEQAAFDEYPGGPRNHDLLVRGVAARGPTVVGIEGKADESFGQTVAQYAAAAKRRAERGESTNARKRLDGLLRNLTGSSLDAEPALGDLRYQLFSAVAGTLAAAADAQAAFVVHEFVTRRTTDALRKVNAADLAAFVLRAFGAECPEGTAWLVGPFAVSGTSLWVGKLTTRL
jgi:hypothetical protein